jgi:ATP-dependent helicase/nuclease subunit B
MRLTGRIDRLDAMKTESGTYFRIIDYKSGNKELKLQDAYYGLQLQLLTYMTAVENQEHSILPKPLVPGGVLYFRLDDPIIQSDRSMDEEKVEQAIKSKLKMKGLLLADPQIIKEMDRSIDGTSKYLPARINKDGNLGASSAATIEQFGVLEKYIENLLKELGSNLAHGNVALLPFKRKKQTACDYCEYGSVCAFDPTLPDNNYKNIRTMKNDEAIGCMRSKLDLGLPEGSDA